MDLLYLFYYARYDADTCDLSTYLISKITHKSKTWKFHLVIIESEGSEINWGRHTYQAIDVPLPVWSLILFTLWAIFKLSDSILFRLTFSLNLCLLRRTWRTVAAFHWCTTSFTSLQNGNSFESLVAINHSNSFEEEFDHFGRANTTFSVESEDRPTWNKGW